MHSSHKVKRILSDWKYPLSSSLQGKTAGKDLASSKTTYPSLLGLDKSKRIAEDLISQAIAQLKEYDQEKAAPLVGLAQYIRSRTNWVLFLSYSYHWSCNFISIPCRVANYNISAAFSSSVQNQLPEIANATEDLAKLGCNWTEFSDISHESC